MSDNLIEMDLGDYTVFQCPDCGAHASTPEMVDHFTTCIPGDSERWKEYYSKDYETGIRSE